MQIPSYFFIKQLKKKLAGNNQHKCYFKYFEKQNYSTGFTLIELMIAMLLTTIVMSLAGFGLVTMMDRNQKAEAQTLRRTELNRALDFIADDIRESKSASTTAPTGWSVPSGYSSVLYLTKPDDSKVAYYIKSNPGVIWRGPQAIYRSITSGSAGDVLVDAVKAPTTAPSCLGTSGGTSGFYVCVNNNRVINLYLYGKLSDSSEPYQVINTVFARSATPPPAPTPGAGAGVSAGVGASVGTGTGAGVSK